MKIKIIETHFSFLSFRNLPFGLFKSINNTAKIRVGDHIAQINGKKPVNEICNKIINERKKLLVFI